MLKPLIKLSAMGYLWQRYRDRAKPFVYLLLVLILIFLLHSEYLSYAETAGKRHYVGISFAVKWVVITTAVLVYLLFPLRFKVKGSEPTVGVEKKPLGGNSAGGSATDSARTSTSVDPFAEIRKKKRLKGKSDFILDDRP